MHTGWGCGAGFMLLGIVIYAIGCICYDQLYQEGIAVKIRIISAILIMFASLFISCAMKAEFDGSSLKNRDSFLLDFRYMDGSDHHVLELEEGGILHVQLIKEQGSIRLRIEAPDGSEAYSGNGEAASEFSIRIEQNGSYSVYVEAIHAKGSIHVFRD